MNAPLLAVQLPASDSTTWTIPFDYPVTVAPNEVTGFKMRVLGLYTGEELAVFLSNGTIAEFSVGGTIVPKEYYKIQLAFMFGGAQGDWSESAIIKYTSNIALELADLDATKDYNNFIPYFTGKYENEDITEKQTEYCFEIYYDGKLVDTSDWRSHDHNLTADVWQPSLAPMIGTAYQIRYGVKTVNLMTKWTEAYTIVDFGGLHVSFPASIGIEYCMDDACYNLYFVGGQGDINGHYAIFRASDEDNWSTRQELGRVEIAGWEKNSKRLLIFQDRTIAHGFQYKYMVTRVNANGIYSSSIGEKLTEPIEFEDMYLSDAERQLRIRFNPKVSSFKNTLLETKTDTIGGAYPFFYRNGKAKYKEFSISGLLSLLADEHEMFKVGGWEDMEMRRISTNANVAEEELRGSLRTGRTQLTGKNVDDERNFKLEVLAWLTNGQPKLFRSPTEGNYIVRLMNTSLSPNDTVGRMLHTFTSTAYEIDNYNFYNLIKNKIVDITEKNKSPYEMEKTVITDKTEIVITAQELQNIEFLQIKSDTNTEYSIGDSNNWVELKLNTFKVHTWNLTEDIKNNGLIIRGKNGASWGAGSFLKKKKRGTASASDFDGINKLTYTRSTREDLIISDDVGSILFLKLSNTMEGENGRVTLTYKFDSKQKILSVPDANGDNEIFITDPIILSGISKIEAEQNVQFSYDCMIVGRG